MARRYGWSGILVWLAAFGAMAAGPTPGEYGTKQGWGSLQVGDKGGARHFEMLAVVPTATPVPWRARCEATRRK